VLPVKKGENFNHPKPGSEIKVEPIKSTKDINSIKKLLSDRPRDYCLLILGINTNLRASDLLQIKAGQVKSLKPMDEIEIKEKKTGKRRRVSLNKACVEAIKRLLATKDYGDNDPLFSGRRGPLTVPSVNRLVKEWCDAVNLKGNYGSHTLRKTFGFHQRVTFGRGVAELMVVFNHSSEKQTLSYLCVQPEEVKSIYANEL
jgi:integrase